MNCNLMDIFKQRRSIYNLGHQLPVSEAEAVELVGECIKNAPSAFNSQSGRAVVLFGTQHQKLWDIVLKHLQKVTPEDRFPATKQKIASFAAGYGTVLFFEDDAVVTGLQKKFPLYKEAFSVFSCQSSGMLQYMVWTAFADVKIGASLQHYNPLIDDDVKKEWNLPSSWRLMSQMPFGSIEAPAGDKDFLPLDIRFKVFA